MKKRIRLTEGDLHRIVKESVKRVIREWSEDYEGNDLDYESIKSQAEHIIPQMYENNEAVSWWAVAVKMGFRLNTLNGDDLELLKDTIEEVMAEETDPYYAQDAEFESDFNNLPYAN